MYLWPHWVFAAAHWLSLALVSGGYCSARVSHCSGSSCCFRARGLSNCSSQAQVPRSIWDLPAPGIKHVSPPLLGGFLTTCPPRKPYNFIQGKTVRAVKIIVVWKSAVLSSGFHVKSSVQWINRVSFLGPFEEVFSTSTLYLEYGIHLLYRLLLVH